MDAVLMDRAVEHQEWMVADERRGEEDREERCGGGKGGSGLCHLQVEIDGDVEGSDGAACRVE